MDFLKNKETQRILFILAASITFAFIINIFLKLHMYGERTTDAGESWLSTVSAIYIDNWLTEGILNLKFAMIRTFDSVEMRNFYDREVYASFLPGALFVPFLVAKIFSLKASLVYIEGFASLYHYLGALVSTLITFLLCRRLEMPEKKVFWFALFTGLAYIYSCVNFRVLSFGYYTDTSIYLIYVIFLLTEFTKNNNTRLLQKAVMIFIGFFHEWFFVSITLVSIFAEINREGGRQRIGQIVLFHLAPTFMALGIYVYHLQVLDKLEHSIYRMLRRSALNPVSGTSFDHSFSDLWKQLFQNNKFTISFTALISVWNTIESKIFKENEVYKSLFTIAFGSSILQLLIALQHSAEHKFVGIKLLIPLGIFMPFFFEEVSKLFSKKIGQKILVISLSSILVINLFVDAVTLASFKKEHRIYKQLDKAFKDYGHEDLFFSYNLEILLDKYPKEDIRTTEQNVRPFDRIEGEPYMHYSTRKQVYIMVHPRDIIKMVDNRKLRDKAKVHIIFYKHVCNSIRKTKKVKQLAKEIFVVDVPTEDLNSPDFLNNYACDEPSKWYGYFGTITEYNKD